jgi:quercetin dioxygenase-like cupin family protein
MRAEGGIESVEVLAGETWRFEFPPGIPHACENTGSDTMVLVAFSSHPHDPADPDTFRDLLIG